MRTPITIANRNDRPSASEPYAPRQHQAAAAAPSASAARSARSSVCERHEHLMDLVGRRRRASRTQPRRTPMRAPNGCRQPPASARTNSAARPAYSNACPPLSRGPTGRSGGSRDRREGEDERHVDDDRRPAGESNGLAVCRDPRDAVLTTAGTDTSASRARSPRPRNPANISPPNRSLLARIVLGEEREDQRDEEREQRQQQQVALHHLRPSAMS